MKHTPKPWRFDPNDGLIDSEFGCVATVVGCTNPDDETKPNGDLIAAAPDMLEALEECEKAIGDYVDFCIATNPAAKYAGQGKRLVEIRNKSKAAIRKAKGEA